MTEQELVDKLRQYEDDILRNKTPTQVKIIIGAIIVALLAVAGVAGYYYFKHDQAVILTEQQIKQTTELAKALDLSQKQAEVAKKLIAEAQDKPPEIRYVVQAPTIEQAAVNVKKDIEQGKSPANQVPADKTIVTPNTIAQKVDVYRIKLDKARWGVNGLVLAGGTDPVEAGMGPAYHNKDWALSAGVTSRSRTYVMAVKYF